MRKPLTLKIIEKIPANAADSGNQQAHTTNFSVTEEMSPTGILGVTSCISRVVKAQLAQ